VEGAGRVVGISEVELVPVTGRVELAPVTGRVELLVTGVVVLVGVIGEVALVPVTGVIGVVEFTGAVVFTGLVSLTGVVALTGSVVFTGGVTGVVVLVSVWLDDDASFTCIWICCVIHATMSSYPTGATPETDDVAFEAAVEFAHLASTKVTSFAQSMLYGSNSVVFSLY